jgi:hypothetical protein
LDIQQIKVRQLVEDYRLGRLVIPEFQREYVWKPSRAPRLLDSIYRGYSVSVLLLWTSSAEPRARRRDPRPSRGSQVSWLIDGQQRVITLSRILSGDEGIDVVFNPDQDAFLLTNAATKRDGNWVRVSELFDDESYRNIRRSLPEGVKGERREAQLVLEDHASIRLSAGTWREEPEPLIPVVESVESFGTERSGTRHPRLTRLRVERSSDRENCGGSRRVF